jgi:hypothetical protein
MVITVTIGRMVPSTRYVFSWNGGLPDVNLQRAADPADLRGARIWLRHIGLSTIWVATVSRGASARTQSTWWQILHALPLFRQVQARPFR